MTMTDCPDSGALTELAVEGVDPDQVLAHLATCESCQQRYDEIRSMLGGLNLLIATTGDTPDSPPTRRVPAVIDKYFVVGTIGESPHSTTFRAVQSHLHANEFAIVLAHEPWSDPDPFQPCFEAACGPLGSLDHPSIAPAEDADLFEDRPYIVYRYVDGEPLVRVLAQGPIPGRYAAKTGADLASGLAYARRSGLVHGGLTVDSIRINREGRAVIADFAAPRLLQDPTAKPDPAADLVALEVILERMGAVNPGATDLEGLARKLERKGRSFWKSFW